MEIIGGPLFGVAGAGESHGPGVTTIVFGCPPGLWIDRNYVQSYLDRRRPGANKLGTPRRENDKVAFLSGLYCEDHDNLLSGPKLELSVDDVSLDTCAYEKGFTTGEPIAAIVLSAAKRSQDYAQFLGSEGEVRPGHSDLVKYYQSKGFVDPRGGGRSSYRSTISEVIGGSIARIFLEEHFSTVLLSSICQVGPIIAKSTLGEYVEEISDCNGRIRLEELNKLQTELSQNSIHTIDSTFAGEAADFITKIRKQKDSVGAAVEVVAVNVPALIGAPLYKSLKSRLMSALGGLHAVQACEIGAGYDVSQRFGSKNNDPIRSSGYVSNNHGGLLGGITTGKPLVCRVSFKPTSTIAKQQLSIRKNMEDVDFELRKGRHDPCVGVRAGVTLESRMAIEIMNALMMHQSGCIDTKNFNLFKGD